MRRISRSLLSAGLAVLSACRPVPSRAPVKPSDSGPPVAFVDVRVFDGTAILEGQTVVVAGGRISAVGPSPEVEPPRVPSGRARIVEGAGKTLLPGFIDTHVHIAFYKPRRVLEGGVTTARDLGWPPERIFPLANRLASAPDEGPFLLAAGPMITAPGGYPKRAGWAPRGTAREVSSKAEAAAAVRELAGRGAAVIKVAQEPGGGPLLSTPLLVAIVGATHAAGLKVTSHLGSLDQLEVALDAGVDELAHGLWSDEAIPLPTIRRMVEAGTVVVPTLHIDPSPRRIENLRRFLAAGGRVVYGTDMGNAGPPPGIDVEELALMERAGMSRLQILAAATSGAAKHLDLEGRGRIVPGALADLILVEGDPTRDLEVLARPLMVMRGGPSIPSSSG